MLRDLFNVILYELWTFPKQTISSSTTCTVVLQVLLSWLGDLRQANRLNLESKQLQKNLQLQVTENSLLFVFLSV